MMAGRQGLKPNPESLTWRSQNQNVLAGNPKSEYRNSKQIRNPNTVISKRRWFWILAIRDSDFGISSKLDLTPSHFELQGL
jgi:hypothetical protein